MSEFQTIRYEAQGPYTALSTAFSHQQLAHAHNWMKYGTPVDPGFGSSVPGESKKK